VNNIPVRNFRISPLEIGVVLVVILIFFGAARIFRMGGSLGRNNAQSKGVAVTKREGIRNPSKTQWLGIFIAIVGAGMLLIAFKGFSLLTSFSFWGIIVIAIGAVIFIVARRR